MQSAASTLVVLGTGGTIAGSAESADDNVSYRSATLPVATLVATLDLPAGLPIESEQVAQLAPRQRERAVRLVGVPQPGGAPVAALEPQLGAVQAHEHRRDAGAVARRDLDRQA